MGHKVQLAVYDLSQGMARQLGSAILGIQIEGIWHTGVIVYGREYFFGGGIVAMPHQEVLQVYGMRPVDMLDLGETDIPSELFDEYLREISPRFTPDTYDLIRNNCNNFSNECAAFLLGRGIPEHIVDLPERVFSSPMGAMLRPMIEQMQGSMRAAIPGFHMETYDRAGHRHVDAAPPLVPSHHTTPPPPAMANPWANTPAGASAPAPPATPAVSVEAQAPQMAKAEPAPPEDQQLATLAANSKPFISTDSPSVMATSLPSILTKLRAISSASDPPLLSEADDKLLDEVQIALLEGKPLPQQAADLLLRIVKDWPGKAEFTALSLLRLLATQPSFASTSVPIIDLLLSLVGHPDGPGGFKSKVSPVMALCMLTNTCSHPRGSDVVLHPDRKQRSVDAALSALRTERPEVRQMASSFLANLALAVNVEPGSSEEVDDTVLLMLCGALEGLAEDSDATSGFRRLLAAARLLQKGGNAVRELAGSLGFEEVVTEAGKTKGGDCHKIALDVLALLRAQ